MIKAKVIEKYSIEIAAGVSRYYQDNGITYFYPARGGAVAAISKHSGGDYWVLLFKANKHISHVENSTSPEHRMGLLIRFAGEKGFLKKNMPKVSGKELAALLLRKLGVSTSSFHKLFPELKDAAREDGKDVAGMNVLHIDEVRNAAKVIQAIEKAAKIVKDAGFGHLLYGDVFLIGSAMSQKIAADYNRETDSIRFKTSETSDDTLVRNMIHELGHRQYYKFKVNQTANNQKYNEITQEKSRLKQDDEVKAPDTGKIYVVEYGHYERGKYKYKLHHKDEPTKKATGTSGIENWERVKGEKANKSLFNVSTYAHTSATEFWPEVFATALMGKNPELLKWVDEVTK